MVTVPSEAVVFLAGIFGFAITLDGESSPSSSSSDLMRFRGDDHVVVYSVVEIATVLVGESLPCLRLCELLEEITPSSISGLISLCDAVSPVLSHGSCFTLTICFATDLVRRVLVFEESALTIRAVSRETFEVRI